MIQKILNTRKIPLIYSCTKMFKQFLYADIKGFYFSNSLSPSSYKKEKKMFVRVLWHRSTHKNWGTLIILQRHC